MLYNLIDPWNKQLELQNNFFADLSQDDFEIISGKIFVRLSVVL